MYTCPLEGVMFMQAIRRGVRALLLPGLLIGTIVIGAIAVSAADQQSFTTWTQYLGSSDSAQYSSLKQITKANVKQLEIAWSYPTGNGSFIFDPIVVDGVMYVLKAGTPPPAPPQPSNQSNNQPGGPPAAKGPPAATVIAALDASTGKELWVHPNMGAVGTRGMNYWESKDRGDRRLLYVNAGFLTAIDARTGQTINTFGDNGRTDLRTGLDREAPRPLQTSNPGRIFEHLIIMPLPAAGAGYDSTATDIHAYDVRTGKLAWVFHTIPHPGEFGYETWPPDAWKTASGVHNWSEMTLDEKRGIAYIPLGTARYDFYGANRKGNDLFANSLLALDARTGKRLWHFQMVHHDLWDYDLPAAPKLLTVKHNGKIVDAIAQPTKFGYLYVFDRVTGEPLWPIEERPVPQSDVAGEWSSPTQPFPTKPPAYARNYINVPDDLIDFTPQLRAQAKDNIARYKTGPMFLPPVVGDPNGFLGAMQLGNASGGTNWPGAGYDPETHIVYAQANQGAVSPISLRKPPDGFSDIHYVLGRNDTEFRVAEGPGFGSAADAPQPTRRAAATPGPATQAPVGGLTVQGLSLVKPPYGVISAIDLDRGDLKWQVPYAETPDAVRNNPALKGMNIPNTGQSGSVGLVVTKTLVILGDSQVTSVQHPRGAMLRAYDKTNGKEVGAILMPAPQSGSPMTYSVDGKQYIVVAVSGGAYSGEYIAYRLPESE